MKTLIFSLWPLFVFSVCVACMPCPPSMIQVQGVHNVHLTTTDINNNGAKDIKAKGYGLDLASSMAVITSGDPEEETESKDGRRYHRHNPRIVDVDKSKDRIWGHDF